MAPRSPYSSSSEPSYDAIVVGSGASGGAAARALAEQGLTVLILEAGREVTPRDLANGPIANAKRLANLAAGRQSIQASHPGYWKANPDLYTNELDNPYSTPEDKPFTWTRGRQVGGRSLTWGGITLRLSDYEFKAASRDGYGQDWPIDHGDLAPYYDELEAFLQVQGNRDGLTQLPDGQYQPAASLTPAELRLQRVVEQHWPDRRLIASRGFALHQSTREQPWSRASSQGSALGVALKTGRVTLRSDAVVSHVTIDPDTRLATGVCYVDRQAKTEHFATAKLVVLCASTIESVRILLHSSAAVQPGGLVDQSGLLGRNLMDHVSMSQFFVIPGIEPPQESFELSGGHSCFIPNFCNLEKQDQDFLRGYGIWGGIQRFDPPSIFRKVEGAIGFLIAHGEVLARDKNRVTLNTNLRDAWGLPVPHIECAWSDNEHKMLAHMHQQIDAKIDKVGGIKKGLSELFHMPIVQGFVDRMEAGMAQSGPPGFYIHEVGGAPMGRSPQMSVLNEWNQVWGTPNLLVTDGACWVSSGWQSPTLTMMAITTRACRSAAVALKSGTLGLKQ